MSFKTTAVIQMANEWEKPSRRSLDYRPDSPDGGSSSDESSPHSSLQHIPAYNYFDSATHQQHQLHHYPPNQTYSSNNKKSTTSATKGAADRNYRHKMLERAAYANRSFMHHNEYNPSSPYYSYQQPHPHPQPSSASSFQRSGGAMGYGGGFMFETSHYPLDQDARKGGDRRRHSMHHIAQLSASKMDDLKQRFDEYSSSAAVGRGGTGGGGGRSRRPSPRQQYGGGSQFIVVDGGRLGYGGGSRSLDTCEQRTSPTENGGGSRQKGTSAKTPKRGSRSSQGSTDSSHSSHSASSGSLLLTVANLENFAKIHKKQESSYGTSKAMEEYLSSTVGVVPTAAILDAVGSKYNSNITMKHTRPEDIHQAAVEQLPNNSSAAIISIEEIQLDLAQQQSESDEQKQAHRHSLPSFHRSAKTKDPDSVSMASSTHFTMVNGVGGPQRLPKGGICSRGHQITILIVTMSIVFMVGICAAVFFLEMRAREMPR